MQSNLERYKNDLSALIAKGVDLFNAMQFECYPTEFRKSISDDVERIGNGKAEPTQKKEVVEKFIMGLPSTRESYQSWYSESKVLIKQLLPDRLADFTCYYERPKSRKEVSYENYVIEDYLQGMNVTRGYQKEKVVGPEAAIPKFRQQLAILKSLNSRFESTLFDIRQLVQADLFDSELDAAGELAKHKFYRAAGAMSGVVLERHLGQVCDNHGIKLTKKNPTIADLNDALKNASVTDTAAWRHIQHLGDLRNMCDHSKNTEPTSDNIKDLIDGVKKVSKTLF